MSNESITCPEYKARLNTAASLVETVKMQLRQGVLRKRNLVWLELTGCSGNIISLLDGSNPDFKYLISEMTHFIYNCIFRPHPGSSSILVDTRQKNIIFHYYLCF